MSARKLSRLAGFALFLAALVGGVGVAGVQAAGGHATAQSTVQAVAGKSLGDVIWT